MTLTQRMLLLLLPELRDVPEPEKASALRKARETDFEVPELLGIALAVVAVTALTQYSLDGSSAWWRVAGVFANFALALPLLAVCAGPLHLRRLRRGLRSQLRRPS